MTHEAPIFSSFLQAGFECTYALPKEGKRMHMLSVTRHDVLCREDYVRILELGMQTVREGFSWHEIDKGQGKVDFSRYIPLLETGKEMGIQQIWDLNHFDYPEDLDFFSPDFPKRFEQYALRVHEVLRRYIDGLLYVVPFNEISYFSWIAGEVGRWAPFATGRGEEVKRQLVAAAVRAMRALRDHDADVRFIHPDPLLYRAAVDRADTKAVKIAYDFAEVRFHAWDMLSGRRAPELGGEPSYLDVLGINYYYTNQEWIIPDKEHPGNYTTWAMPWESEERISFAQMLQSVYERYQKPMVITETGSHGELRERWWGRTLREIDDARQSMPIYGVCAYPVIDYPDWIGGHLTNSGLWDFKADDTTCLRVPHDGSIELLKEYAKRQYHET